MDDGRWTMVEGIRRGKAEERVWQETANWKPRARSLGGRKKGLKGVVMVERMNLSELGT